MRVGVDEVQAAGAEIEMEADVKHGAARDMERARDTEQHGTPREVDVRHGHLDANLKIPGLWHRLDAKNFAKIFRFPVTSNL
jgi:hypothetical protein